MNQVSVGSDRLKSQAEATDQNATRLTAVPTLIAIMNFCLSPSKGLESESKRNAERREFRMRQLVVVRGDKG